jgi:O-antigen ligase
VALIAIGLALSGSVSGMAAASVAVLVWLSSPLVRAPARVAVAGAIVCALAIVTLAGARVSSPVQRLAQIANPTTQAGGSVQDRLAIAEQAWPRIKANPIVGAGLDTADSGVTIISHDYTTPYQIHGLPLAAWYQTGVFGMIGIVALLVVLATVGWRGLAGASSDDDQLVGLSLLAAFLAFVVVAMTQPMVFQEYGWISAVLVIAWRLRIDARADRVLVAFQPDSRGSPGQPAHALPTTV